MLRSAIVVFPGTNRDQDMCDAISRFAPAPVRVAHTDTRLPEKLDLLVIPGGFSYGDYLRCGAIAARTPIMREAANFARKGGKIFGVCNGFQILCEAGLLPGALIRNQSGKFVCKQTRLTIENADTVFTNQFLKNEEITVPVAHGEGNYRIEPETEKELTAEGRIALRYTDNFNGSVGSIAGVLNREKNILGMMPHPENAVFAHQAGQDGVKFFESLFAN